MEYQEKVGGISLRNFTILRAKKEEIEEIYRLWVTLITSHEGIGEIGGFKFDPFKFEQLKVQLEKEILHEKFLVLVAKYHGEILGFAKANQMTYPSWFENNTFCLLGQIYVKEPFRNQGIGKMFLKETEIWCKEKGIEQIRLSVNVENKEGIEFYKSLNFNPINMTLTKEVNL